MVASLFALLSLLFTPISQFFLGIRESPLRIFIPGLDECTSTGFAILCGYHFALLIFGYVTFCSFDMLLFVVIANISMLASIRNRRLEELEMFLRYPKHPKCHSVQIKERMRNIIWMHWKYNQWVLARRYWENRKLRLKTLKRKENMLTIIMFLRRDPTKTNQILFFHRLIDELDKSFFIICFVQTAAAIIAASITLYICITVGSEFTI